MFSDDIKLKAMITCGRRCCICHKFCGNNMEVHHIKAKADGGPDTFENAIPLCFDCHAMVRQYDPKHPKGIKFLKRNLSSTVIIGMQLLKREARNLRRKNLSIP